LFGAFLYFYVWAFGTQQVRHLIPVLTLLAVAAAITLAQVIKKIPNRKTGRLVQAILLLAASAYIVYVMDQDTTPYGSHETGVKFLKRNRDDVSLDQFVNSRLPAKARILSPSLDYGLFFERELISPNLLGTPQISQLLLSETSVKGVYRKLKAKRITYILLDTHAKKRHYPKNFRRLLDNKRLVVQVFKNRKYILFELLPWPPPAPTEPNLSPSVQPVEPATLWESDPASATPKPG
jgi:hypothetical protein